MRRQCGVAIVAATLVTARDGKFEMNPHRSIRAMEPGGSSCREATAVAGRRKANAPSSTGGVCEERPSWALPVRRGALEQQQLERRQHHVLHDAARHHKIKKDSSRVVTPATGGSGGRGGGRGAKKVARVRRWDPITLEAVVHGKACTRSSGNAEGSAATAAAVAAAGGYGKLPLLRGGGHGTPSWLSGGGEQYLEFPDDFDYEDDSGSVADGCSSSSMEDGEGEPCWSDDEDEPTENVATVADSPPATWKLNLDDGADGASPASPSNSAGWLVADAAEKDEEDHDHDGASASSWVASTAPDRGIEPRTPGSDPTRGDLRREHQLQQRPVLGAALGALVGAAGLKLWEGLLAYRRQREVAASEMAQVSGGVGRGEAPIGEGHEEKGAAQRQSKIQALEDQLAFLEEDRRRVMLATKEARASRREEDRQLKEYVHALEAHLDQLSREKEESEAAMLEIVRAETAKALEQAQAGSQATALAAAEEARRARSEGEAARALLEAALAEQSVFEQEKTAAEALLRTQQAKGAALEKEVERLRESTAALNQRLWDVVAKAERDAAGAAAAAAAVAAKARATEEEGVDEGAAVAAAVAAAREEETARCRQEMEIALAEEKEMLREQMEARLATMRAGLKRRLQEARLKRAAAAAGTSPVTGSGGSTGDGASGSRSNLPPR